MIEKSKLFDTCNAWLPIDRIRPNIEEPDKKWPLIYWGSKCGITLDSDDKDITHWAHSTYMGKPHDIKETCAKKNMRMYCPVEVGGESVLAYSDRVGCVNGIVDL